MVRDAMLAWYDFSGSSSRMRGSSLGRFSLPIHVSSSRVFAVLTD